MKNCKNIYGKPDIAFPGKKIAIFCDGEFWHGYKWDETKFKIKSNRNYWWKKIETNINRDNIVNAQLKDLGWVVLRFWNNDIIKNPDKCILEIERYLK